MNSENLNPEAGGDSLPQQPDVVLVHGMWSLPETLRELHDAFVAMGYGVESLCLPHHYEKSAYDDDRKARLAAARLEEYVDHIVDGIAYAQAGAKYRQASFQPQLYALGSTFVRRPGWRLFCQPSFR